jgi:hypothetical protein
MPRERLLLDLDRSVPGFAEYLGSDANLFASATPAAIFAACSHFVRDRPIDSEHWHALANLVNDAVAGPDESRALPFISALNESSQTVLAWNPLTVAG